MPETKVNKTALVIVGIVLCIAATVFSLWKMGISLEAVLLLYIMVTLISLSLIDQATMEIPNWFHLLILIAAVASVWFGASYVSLTSRVIGFFIVSVPMYVITCLTNGFGGGDIKLMAVAGALLGAKGVACAFFVGIFAAAIYCIYIIVYALVAIIRRKAKTFKEGMNDAMKTPFAFGPYLSIGIIVSYVYADQIVIWYLNTFMSGYGA